MCCTHHRSHKFVRILQAFYLIYSYDKNAENQKKNAKSFKVKTKMLRIFMRYAREKFDNIQCHMLVMENGMQM